MSELSCEAMQAALKIGVDEGLIRKVVDTQTYLDTWSTVQRMIIAAVQQERIQNSLKEWELFGGHEWSKNKLAEGSDK